MSTDGTERRFVCEWTQCGKAFSHPDNLRVHYRRHTDEKPHHCHHCEAAYRQKSGLKYHLEKVHGEKPVGRCGRKRKLAMESNSILASTSSNQIPSNGSLALYSESSKSGELHSDVVSRSGQNTLLDRDTRDSVTVNAKHTALSQVHEINIDMSDLQTKRWSKSDTDSSAKCRRWSLPESLSQDCEDNLENIDINDEWLLNEDDGFMSGHRKPSEAVVTGSAEDGDRELAGSTSDTEPLDEDLCEELRKLSDAINSEVLSPRGLENISPFASPVDTAYGVSKPDHLANVMPAISSSRPGFYQDNNSRENHTGVYDHFSSTSPVRDSDVTSDFYPRHPEACVTAISASGMLTPGQCNSSTSDQTEMVNGYLPEGYSCPEIHTVHFDRNTSAADTTHLPVNAPEIVEQGSYHSAPFEGSIHPWSVAASSSRWNSNSSDNSTAFLPAHGVCPVPAGASAESGFGSQIGHEDGVYSSLMSTWSPAENSQPWLGPDGVVPTSWPQRHLASVRGQADVSRRTDWLVGRQAESAFSRSIPAFDGRVGFDVARQTSSKLCVPYRTDVSEVPSVTDHFVDSFAGKHTSIYPASGISHMGSWPDLYARSSHMTGIGNYEYGFPRSVYRSPVEPERFYLTSGYSGVQSHASYEQGVETESSRGISNSPYRIPPVHVPVWPMSGLPDAGESLRAMPDAQQSSMLYNVVPRYY